MTDIAKDNEEPENCGHYDCGVAHTYMDIQEVWDFYKKIYPNVKDRAEAFDLFLTLSEIKRNGGSIDDAIQIAAWRGNRRFVNMLTESKRNGMEW